VLPLPPERLEVVATPDTVSAGSSSMVKVVALSSDGREASLDPASWIWFRVSDTSLGLFLRSDGELADRVQVRYRTAKNTGATFIATTQTPRCDTAVDVTATGSGLSGSETILIRGHATPEAGGAQLALRVEPDSLQHGAAAPLYTEIVGPTTCLPDAVSDSTLVTFTVADTYHGSLAYGGRRGQTIADVPYIDAKNGQVTFIADGAEPAMDTPLVINAFASSLSASDTLVVLSDRVVRLRVEPDPGVLDPSSSVLPESVIHVIAENANGREVALPEGATVTLSIPKEAYDDHILGFIAPYAARVVESISYEAARNGSVIAGALAPGPEKSTTVPIHAVVDQDPALSGDGSILVSGRGFFPDAVHYSQRADCGAPWGNDLYDHSTQTISTLGCAVSSLAMAMTAFGFEIEPGELNTWKQGRSLEDGGFDGENTNWTAANKYTNYVLKARREFARGDMWDIQPSNPDSRGRAPNHATTTSTAVLDSLLEARRIVLVQVANYSHSRDRWSQHWVVVTGRTYEGSYLILDPASCSHESISHLDFYGNKFWGYVVVEHADYQ
jgi:hypothetical protein